MTSLSSIDYLKSLAPEYGYTISADDESEIATDEIKCDECGHCVMSKPWDSCAREYHYQLVTVRSWHNYEPENIHTEEAKLCHTCALSVTK